MKRLLIIFIIFSALYSCETRESDGPYFATGIKIGEVTQSSAIIWVRLTENSVRVDSSAPMPIIRYIDPETSELGEIRKGRPDLKPVVTYPDGYNVNNIEGAVPGSEGRVRLNYRISGLKKWVRTSWEEVDSQKSYTYQFHMDELTAGELYELQLEASPTGKRKISATINGKFRTAPKQSIEAAVSFIVTTGTSYNDVDSDNGYKFYMSALDLKPDFFIHTGDIVYYDRMGKTADLARWHWDRMYSYANNIKFHSNVPSYFIKDDHDTWMNDAYPGMETMFMGDFTYDQGTEIFLNEVPMGEKTYRTIRWGKDLQIWLVEGRDYRSPNPMEDGPDKTIWGKEQIEWFKSTVLASDATFKILISPTPIVGPDRSKGKNDNHSNKAFQYEGSMLRDFMSKQKNMYSVCGDRHWQYISKDLSTGLVEGSCGPGSDAHAGGWSQDDIKEEHLYLNVCGGFLELEISRKSGEPVLVFRHHNPDGKVLNEYVADLSK